MTWIAINDGAKTLTKADGAQTNALLARGAFVFDFDFSLELKAPCRLVHFEETTDWYRNFTIFLNADCSLSVQSQQGDSSSYVRLADIDVREAAAVRLTYAWDAPGRFGLLSAEISETGAIHQAIFHSAIPLPRNDASRIVCEAKNVTFDGRTQFAGLSDQFVPVGPAPSIAAGAVLETSDGPRPIEQLGSSDLVQTKNNGLQPVRWILKQELPAIGRSAPVRLRAPFFGLTQDILVANDQRVMISGIETEYHFGKEAVLLEVQSLIGHPAVTPVTSAMSATFYQILLDNHDCICVSGAWADSLYVGHLKNAPLVLQTTGLSRIPSSMMPLHQRHAHPILRGFESQALLDTLIA